MDRWTDSCRWTDDLTELQLMEKCIPNNNVAIYLDMSIIAT